MTPRLFILLFSIYSGISFAQAFDHSHRAWDLLLKKHVVLLDGGKASRLRYAEMGKDRGALKGYLETLAAIKEGEFNSWSKTQRMAFLINAYNAYTVEKILTRYPDIKSIWDFGRIFGDPFKDEFFALFGRKFSLNRIEHETLRRPGAYDEPRVHFALNCASIGCPMLREEAFVADRLEVQLEQQAQRFLSDATRNRYANGRLEASKIFDWYKEDFGVSEKYFAQYARLLAEFPEHRKIITEGRAPIAYLDYDWTLNDSRSSSRR